MESRELEEVFIILSVIGQISIDLAKKEFNLNVGREIKRIRNLSCMNKKFVPQFFADTKKRRNNKDLSEDVIMDVINAVEYKQEGWNPWDYHRGLCGIGYSGMKMNPEMRHSVSYYKWKNMIQRCYDKKVHKKYKPEYKDKSVCEEWLNYSNFKIWFDEHYVPSKNNQIDLDKDLLVQGNKVYSPETCVFLLHYQNTMFERSAKDKIYEKEDGTFVIGGGKKKTYATLKEAEDIVCERNQNRIESVAEKCKGSIPMCAYEAMLNWDVRLAMCS